MGVDFIFTQCYHLTGMVLDVNVHPDDELFQIKQIVIETATSDAVSYTHLTLPTTPYV